MKKALRKILDFTGNNKWIFLFFLCVAGFLALAENALAREVMQLDILGYRFVSQWFIHDAATPAVKLLTHLGDAFCLILLTVILMIFVKDKKTKLFIPLNLILVAALNNLLKIIIRRPRPTEFRLIEVSGYSFPSGHSMASMAFYGYLIYLTFKFVKNKTVKRSLSAFLGLLILSVGISRIYLGVHYTSDVLAGFLISFAYLLLFIRITDRDSLKKN